MIFTNMELLIAIVVVAVVLLILIISLIIQGVKKGRLEDKYDSVLEDFEEFKKQAEKTSDELKALQELQTRFTTEQDVNAIVEAVLMRLIQAQQKGSK